MSAPKKPFEIPQSVLDAAWHPDYVGPKGGTFFETKAKAEAFRKTINGVGGHLRDGIRKFTKDPVSMVADGYLTESEFERGLAGTNLGKAAQRYATRAANRDESTADLRTENVRLKNGRGLPDGGFESLPHEILEMHSRGSARPHKSKQYYDEAHKLEFSWLESPTQTMRRGRNDLYGSPEPKKKLETGDRKKPRVVAPTEPDHVVEPVPRKKVVKPPQDRRWSEQKHANFQATLETRRAAGLPIGNQAHEAAKARAQAEAEAAKNKAAETIQEPTRKSGLGSTWSEERRAAALARNEAVRAARLNGANNAPERQRDDSSQNAKLSSPQPGGVTRPRTHTNRRPEQQRSDTERGGGRENARDGQKNLVEPATEKPAEPAREKPAEPVREKPVEAREPAEQRANGVQRPQPHRNRQTPAPPVEPSSKKPVMEDRPKQDPPKEDRPKAAERPKEPEKTREREPDRARERAEVAKTRDSSRHI